VTIRRSLVLADGYISELPSGDALNAGGGLPQVVAGSGLSGGGSVAANFQLDVSLASNPSGIIFVGDTLGINGAAQASANAGLASGNAAVFAANSALASGNNSLSVATAALASGNAALAVLPTLNPDTRNKITLTAAGPIVSGYAVGVDDTGRVQSINRLSGGDSNPPVFNGRTQIRPEGGRAVFQNPGTLVSSTADNSFCLMYRYQTTTAYPNVQAGIIQGSGVTLGTPSVVASVNSNGFIRGTYVASQNKFFYFYDQFTAPNGGNTVGAVVSGTNVFVGTPQVIPGDRYGTGSVVWNPVTDTVLVCGIGSSGLANVATINGLSLTYGSLNLVGSGTFSFDPPFVVYQTHANNFVYASNGSNSLNARQIYTLTQSGQTLLRGNTLELGYSPFLPGGKFDMSYDPLNKVVFVSSVDTDRSTFNRMYGVYVFSTSGSTISMVTSGVANPCNNNDGGLAFDEVSTKTLLITNALGNSNNILAYALTFSGTSLTFGSSGTYLPSAAGFTPNGFSPIYNKATNRCVSAFGMTSISGNLTVLNPFQTYGYTPRVGSFPNVLGVAQSTVASGSPCVVALPGSTYTQPSGNFRTGSFYYADPTTSGLTTSSAPAALWSGQTPWNYIGRAISASGISVLKTL
jgi:hypothetical protein